MFTVPEIYISNNTAFNGNLYPAHIFDWKFSGVNCAAEDYTIGGTNTWQVYFKTDVKIDSAAELRIGGSSGYLMKITDNARVNSSNNYYTITAIPSKVFELDEFLDDNFIEYDDPETLAHLMGRVGWTTTGTGVPYNYTINSSWASQGMTKRQVIGFICQLLGANMVSWTGTAPTLFILNQIGPTAIPYTPSNVKTITIADYSAPGINKIWFGTDGTDVGIAYGTGAQDQQMTLPYNPLIDPDSQDNDSLLQSIYIKVAGNSYTPVKLDTFLDESPTFNQLIGVSGIPTITYTDENSNIYVFPIFNWEVSQSGCTMEATGNPDRSVANQLISNEIAQNGKYNKFKRTLDSTVSEIANLNGDVSALQQTAASLTLSVAGKVGKDEVISSINQTAETITINANKINLVGAVTFSDLDSSTQNTINGKTDSQDVTTIIGNTVNAAYINALEINASKIVATYTKTFRHQDYSSSDYTTIQMLARDKNWTAADLDRYDINMDGQITNADLVKVRNMVNNGTDETATIKTEIDPSKVGKPVAIYANGATTPAVYLNGSQVVGSAGIFNNIQANTVNAPYVYVTESGNSENYIYLYGNQIDFRKRNGNGDYLLGSISPASIVIDSGTTSTTTNYTSGSQSFSCWVDWDYRKWGDGTYECWGKATLYVASGQWDNWGGVRSSQTFTPHLNYPVTFLSAPHEHVTPCPSNDDWGFWISAGATANCNNTTTKTAKYQLIRGADGSINSYSNAVFRIEYYVVGKVSV